MKKTILVCLVIGCCLGLFALATLLPPTATPETFFKITKSGKIIHYDRRGGDNIVVPASVNGITVREIGDSAFAKLPESLQIITPPGKTTYRVGEAIDLSGLVVTAHYDADIEHDWPARSYNPDHEELEVTGFNSTIAAAAQIVSIEYRQRTVTFKVDIIE